MIYRYIYVKIYIYIYTYIYAYVRLYFRSPSLCCLFGCKIFEVRCRGRREEGPLRPVGLGEATGLHLLGGQVESGTQWCAAPEFSQTLQGQEHNKERKRTSHRQR